MARPPAAAGFIPAFFPSRAKTARIERDSNDFYGHGWGFAWPSDRRILYNRASARPDGQPWSERKKLVWWDAGREKWTGNDVPDFVATKPPDHQPPDRTPKATTRWPATSHFILHADGLGWIWVPAGLNDGPLPAHYEPLESPSQQSALSVSGKSNPVANERNAAGERICHFARQRVPARADHLSAHRTSHGRRHVAHAFASGGTSAGIVLRDFVRIGRTNFPSRTATG